MCSHSIQRRLVTPSLNFHKIPYPVYYVVSAVRCELDGGREFTQASNITIREDEVPESSDIVFVIHQDDCNTEVVNQLKDLVDEMEKAFEAEGRLSHQKNVNGVIIINGVVTVNRVDGIWSNNIPTFSAS